MKIGFITDLHLHSDDVAGELPAYQQQVLDGIVAEVARRRLDVVLLGGDDYRHLAPHWSTAVERNANADFRLGLAKTCDVIAISGNHDMLGDHDLLGEKLRSSPFKVHHVEEPGVVTVETSSGVLHVVCLPWIRGEWTPEGEEPTEWARLVSYATAELADDLPAGTKILLAHCAMAGALLRAGQPARKTADPALHIGDMFGSERFDAAFLGHYHHPQDIEWGGKTVAVYGGSLFVREFGEPADKSWVVWDSVTGRYERVPVKTRAKIEIVIDPVEMEISNMRPPGTGRVPLSHLDPETIRDAEIRLIAACPTEEYEVPAEVEAIRDALTEIAYSMEYRAPKPRRVRERSGAKEVAEAETDEEKAVAFWTSLDPLPHADVARRAMELLPELRAEIEGDA